MGLYTSVWLLIEYFLIPSGLLKWFYLSFYLHPHLLVTCQIFLWLKALFGCVSDIIVLPLIRVLLFLFSCFCRCGKSAVLYCFWSYRVGEEEEEEEEEEEIEHDYLEALENKKESDSTFLSFSFSSFAVPIIVSYCELNSLKVNDERQSDHREEDEPLYIDACCGELMEVNDEQLPIQWSSTLPSPQVDPVSEHLSDSLLFLNLQPEEEEALSEHPSDSLLFLNLQLEKAATAAAAAEAEEEEEEEEVGRGEGEFHVEECPITNTICSTSVGSSLLATEMLATNGLLRGTSFEECRTDTISPLLLGEEVANHHGGNEFDPFYQDYSKHMRWFDVLNYERTRGMGAFLEKNLSSPSPVNSPTIMELTHLSSIPPPQLISRHDKRLKRRLLGSLQCDFELVYVAQTCLSWETLNHQYNKTHSLLDRMMPAPTDVRTVTGEFQKFRVILERFMEDERSVSGERYWKYAQERCSLESLLGVPQVSVVITSGEDRDGANEQANNTDLQELLKAIEKCIGAFYAFVKRDNNNKSKNKAWWKLKSSLWISSSPVEDPRDLHLLSDLKQRHREMVMRLKDLQGKKKCWLRRRSARIGHLEESERKEILFALIDLKLVSRVLQMSSISSSHLKWCRSKLNSISFGEGKVIRAASCPLFPIS